MNRNQRSEIRNQKSEVRRWLLLLLVVVQVVGVGCQPKPVLTGTQVALVEPNEPAPFRGVLIGPERWRRIYERLLECEQE